MKPRKLIFLLPALLLTVALGQRWAQTRQEDNQAAREARQLVLQEFRKEVERDALVSAKKFMQATLLPQQVAQSATIRALSLTHLKPHRYKIQGEVEWTQANGAQVRRWVEADLQHGPMDKNWYLLDTEFLPLAP
jgi:hypothetical protein